MNAKNTEIEKWLERQIDKTLELLKNANPYGMGCHPFITGTAKQKGAKKQHYKERYGL